MDKNSSRTFGWYVFHKVYDRRGKESISSIISPEGKEYPHSGGPGKPDWYRSVVYTKTLQDLGLVDKLPTYDNFVPVYTRVLKYFREGGRMSHEFMEEHLRWILGDILSDHWNDLDPQICEFVLDNTDINLYSLYIDVLSHPSVPRSRLVNLLKDTRKNPMVKHTKGGEVGVFILQNSRLPGDLVDMVARTCKKVGIQNDIVDHPMVTKDTLVFLSKEGKSESVKKNSLKMLVEKGWLKV